MADVPETETERGAGERPALEGNLESVRELLFGETVRDLTEKFSSLEETTQRTIDELREEVRQRDEEIETYARREIAALGKRLTVEAKELSGGTKGIGRDLQKATSGLEKRLGQLEASLAQAQQELLDQQQRWRTEILAALSTGIDGLRSEETDRATLANLLTEMASRLLSSPSAPSTH